MKKTIMYHINLILFLGLSFGLSSRLYGMQQNDEVDEKKEDFLNNDNDLQLNDTNNILTAYRQHHTSITIGAWALLKGLSKFPNFNGKIVQVTEYVTRKDRWTVKLLHPVQNKINLGVRAHNLDLIQQANKENKQEVYTHLSLDALGKCFGKDKTFKMWITYMLANKCDTDSLLQDAKGDEKESVIYSNFSRTDKDKHLLRKIAAIAQISNFLQNQQKKEEKVEEIDSWSCSKCTFINPSGYICAICNNLRPSFPMYREEEKEREIGADWTCAKCNFINGTGYICAMCNNPRHSFPMYKEEEKEREIRADWTCTKCTFINKTTSIYCAMCDSKSPAFSGYR